MFHLDVPFCTRKKKITQQMPRSQQNPRPECSSKLTEPLLSRNRKKCLFLFPKSFRNDADVKWQILYFCSWINFAMIQEPITTMNCIDHCICIMWRSSCSLTSFCIMGFEAVNVKIASVGHNFTAQICHIVLAFLITGAEQHWYRPHIRSLLDRYITGDRK